MVDSAALVVAGRDDAFRLAEVGLGVAAGSHRVEQGLHRTAYPSTGAGS
ncbi:hypothetical protein ACFU53_26250 [Streptomyces sp. NPDC057474]